MKLALNLKTDLARKVLLASALLGALPVAVGCSQKNQPPTATKPETEGDKFLPETDPRHLHRIFDAQAASGARSDGTLRGCHFDAGNPSALNSLGEEKLDLMLADDDALPVAVYIDVAGGDKDLAAARQKAVQVYLKDRGLQESQVKVVAGRNESTYGPTAPRLKGEAALEQAAQAAASAGGGSGGGAGTAPPAK